MPATMAAPPANSAIPTGSPNTPAPAMAPTSGSRLRNAPATSADTRLCPNANRVNGTSVPPAASATSASTGTGAARRRRRTLRTYRNQQRAHRGRQELHGGDRDRVAAGQQPALRHRDGGGQEQRRQHQAVAGQCRAAASATRGDQADAAERDHEADPGHRPGHGPVPHRGDDRHHHRHGPDQQGRVGDAGPGDAGVLHHDRTAVPERARGQHLGRERGAQLGPAARSAPPRPAGPRRPGRSARR